ncbi:unnamed protein product [Symbiodinium natans]|uniref:Uncharacterized protein n=1 Tax=Symbiodinium natans TaxID=878477 RepID=A0A812QI05_9DINO|nr:unnamed protein product [Symbiodinium natans]
MGAGAILTAICPPDTKGWAGGSQTTASGDDKTKEATCGNFNSEANTGVCFIDPSKSGNYGDGMTISQKGCEVQASGSSGKLTVHIVCLKTNDVGETTPTYAGLGVLAKKVPPSDWSTSELNITQLPEINPDLTGNDLEDRVVPILCACRSAWTVASECEGKATWYPTVNSNKLLECRLPSRRRRIPNRRRGEAQLSALMVQYRFYDVIPPGW